MGPSGVATIPLRVGSRPLTGPPRIFNIASLRRSIASARVLGPTFRPSMTGRPPRGPPIRRLESRAPRVGPPPTVISRRWGGLARDSAVSPRPGRRHPGPGRLLRPYNAGPIGYSRSPDLATLRTRTARPRKNLQRRGDRGSVGRGLRPDPADDRRAEGLRPAARAASSWPITSPWRYDRRPAPSTCASSARTASRRRRRIALRRRLQPLPQALPPLPRRERGRRGPDRRVPLAPPARLSPGHLQVHLDHRRQSRPATTSSASSTRGSAIVDARVRGPDVRAEIEQVIDYVIFLSVRGETERR